MRTKIDFKKEVLIVLIIIFSILIILPSFLFLNKIKNVVYEKQVLSNYNRISQIKNTMEIVLTEADRILYQTLFDQTIENYPDYYTKLNYMERQKINNKMTKLMASNMYFSDCIVYYPEDQKIMDFKKDQLTNIVDYKNTGFVEQIYNNYKNDTFKEMNLYTIEQQGEITLVLVKPVSVMSYKPRGYLMMSLSPRFIKDILKDILVEEEASFVVYDSSGHQVAVIGDEVQKEDFIKNLPKDDKPSYLEMKINDKNMLVFSTFSKRLDWHFIYRLPVTRMNLISQILGRFIGIVTILVMILALTCAKVLADLFYKPIHRIKDYLDLDEALEGNEIDKILGNIKDIKTDNYNLNHLLDQSKPALRQLMLQKLVLESKKAENILERLEYYHIYFDVKGAFRSGIFSIDTLSDGEQQYSEQQLGLLHLYIKENVTQFFKDYNVIVEFVEKEEHTLIVILNYKQELGAQITELITQMHHEVFRNVKQSVTIGIGAEVDTVKELDKSYKSALKTIQNKVFEGSNQVIYYEALENVENINFTSVYDFVDEICMYLKQNNKKAVLESLKGYFRYVKENTRDSDKFKLSLIYLFTSVLKALDDLGINSEDVAIEQDETYAMIYHIESIEIAEQYFIKIVMNIIMYIDNKQNDKSKEIYLQVKDYIDHNYIDANLNLDIISQQLRFSISYLSKIFKEFEGTSIKPYILEKRVTYAKELLVSSNAKIKEIAEQVGYWNDRAFINNFKKCEGVTPGEYRSINQKK